MEINQLIKKGKINALNYFKINPYDFTNVVFIKQRYLHKRVLDYVKNKTQEDEDKIKKSFLMVNLAEDIILEDVAKLSSSEKLKVELAIALLLNRDQIILFQFDKYFMEKELLFFKKLLKKLVVKYNKTIVLLDCRFSFMLEFVDRLVILTEDNIVKVFDKDDFYNDEIENYLEIPNIMDFVKYVNKDKKVLNNYTSINELIKAIFREV